MKRLWRTAAVIMLAGAIAFAFCGTAYAEKTKNREYVIAQDGSGDFTTIQEGVDKAKDGDTLIICEGVYYEEVLVMAKEINLVGVDRDSCILVYDAQEYQHVPLTIAAGSVSNLTICGIRSSALKLSADVPDEDAYAMEMQQLDDEEQFYAAVVEYIEQLGEREPDEIEQLGEEELGKEELDKEELGDEEQLIEEEPDDMEQADEEEASDGSAEEEEENFKGYAVHIDQNYLYGRSISFENCRIISENSHCVGIGTRGNSVISFENCEILSTGTGSCIFMHDPTTSEVCGTVRFSMKNCSLISEIMPYVVNINSLMPEENFTALTFQNVTVDSRYSDYVLLNNSWESKYVLTYNESGLVGDGWCGLEGYYLTLDCYGNTPEEMNCFLWW